MIPFFLSRRLSIFARFIVSSSLDRPKLYPSNCVRDEIRGTHVRLIATRETVCCSRLETCVAHSPRYLGGSPGPGKCSINIEIAISCQTFFRCSPMLRQIVEARARSQDGTISEFSKWRIFNKISSLILNCPLGLKERERKWEFL